ncbi:MAG TPA: peptide chain release factor 1 [bacterium]|nr:peptide chain release factor 1 [bacterium]HNT64645.1 peptide chain release factor 1 [bacterium]HOX85805.1 peptide chain release factor 1 [bacterium]HPG45212.1 peptide chain release factor 1 [bacterium]HPM97454.1 peptide chain release factor 1 [bacterium]
MPAKLEKIAARSKQLQELLADPAVFGNPGRYKELAKEESELAGIVELYLHYKKIQEQIRGNEELLHGDNDPELVEMASIELKELQAKSTELEEEIKYQMLPRDPRDSRNAVIEIRAGTGGEEAGLFAGELFRMYQRLAERNQWKVEVLSSNPQGIGGVREIIFLVTGKQAYGTLKYEGGVHRVQRVPVTEASGRIHTSAASVAVLPEAEELDIQIDPHDLRIDVFRSSGPGGQSVNTTDSAVRITHIPTGMVVTCQDEKSQHKNKAKALKVLRARLYEKASDEEQEKLSAERRSMVSTGDRSAKIRTYNYPQNRVTDHRIGLTLYRLEEILLGDLDEFISHLQLVDRSEQLKAMT